MKRFPLAPNAPEVSAMAYGVWRLADDPEGTSVRRVREKIDACLEAGITTFDHADIYGLYSCEGLFGQAMAEAPELRNQMDIVTKCGIKAPSDAQPEARIKHYDTTAPAIERAVERSLRELHVDSIDLLLIHRPDWLAGAEETAIGLERVMNAGKVGSVGVSNYSVHQFDLLMHYLGHPPATNQVEVSLLCMDALYDGTLDQCEKHRVHPMAWSPLAGGRLMTGEDEASARTREALTRIGKEYGASPDQIALAWVAKLPCQPQVVIGTNKPERIHGAAQSLTIPLERQHWYELWEAAQGKPIP